MKISANWLEEYVTHGLSLEELTELLTMTGLEVEDSESIGGTFEGVVVGRVLDVRKHPNADRLTVCSVDAGGDAPLSIVCGAPNVQQGQKVPVATVGTTLSIPSRDNPGEREDFTLRKAKIRGEASEGMICAEDELGLSEDHSGIMVLDDSAVVGAPFSEYLSERGHVLGDTAIDVAITPNRPDAICHVGVARDVAAVRNCDLKIPSPAIPESGGAAAEAFRVRVEAPDACPRYVGILVRDVTIGESPLWMQHRLRAVGLRPRNNVVDITNYVMYELGQPLHAFDFDRLAGAEIIVRQTPSVSTFSTLDGKERELPQGTLMIADADRDIAVAGVMGGENSEVTDETRDVLIESAYFDPVLIRRTARALQIQTDASYRFERGIDPTGQARAAARAAELMAELAGGTAVPGMVDANPRKHESRTEKLRLSRIGQVLGIEVPEARVVDLLTRIGFEVKRDGNATLQCTIPAFRPDVEREIDIIEEVARLVGFDSIPDPDHSIIPNHTVRIAPTRRFREQTRDLLVGYGFREVVTNSLLGPELARNFLDPVLPGAAFGGDAVDTLNPVSREMATLRPSLLPGVLRVAGHNANRGRSALRYFEFGNTQVRADSDRSLVDGYTESECLSLLAAGEYTPASWDTSSRNVDLFDMKGIVEALLLALRVPNLRMAPLEDPGQVAAQALAVYSNDVRLGVVGRIHPGVATSFDLAVDCYFAELDWIGVSDVASPFIRRQYIPFSRHPLVERDIAVTAHRTTPVGEMIDSIRASGGSLLQDVRVFDLYEGDQIGQEEKSVAFGLTFGSERTLRDKEVDESVAGIVSALEKNHDAKLRR